MVSLEQENGSIQLFLNDRPVIITGSCSVVNRLRTDDEYLSNYIKKIVKAKQISFLNDSDLHNLRVKRATVKQNDESGKNLIAVWFQTRSGQIDIDATNKLMEIRCIKYKEPFRDKSLPKHELWDQVAKEMRHAGYDVNGPKCDQKFRNIRKICLIQLKYELQGSDKFTGSQYYDIMRDVCMDCIDPIWLRDIEKIKNLNQDGSDVVPPFKKQKNDIQEPEIIYLEGPRDLDYVVSLDKTNEKSPLAFQNKEMTSEDVNCIKPEVHSINNESDDEIAEVETENCQQSITNQQLNRLCKLFEEKNRQNEKLVSVFERIADKI